MEVEASHAVDVVDVPFHNQLRNCVSVGRFGDSLERYVSLGLYQHKTTRRTYP
jgi:hypothetical protein